MSILFSVIIPVFRDWERLARCLDALSRQTLAVGEFEIIVADNEPEAGNRPLELPGNARMIHVPRPGSYAARNAAVGSASGRYLAFTDSDCVPSPEWLREGLRVLQSNPGARATGPIMLFREPGSSNLAYLYEAQGVLNQLVFIERGYCATANLLVERSVFDRIGPFDEGLFSGGDLEWGNRALRADVPIIYDEGVSVGHPARPTVSHVLKRKRRFAGAAAAQADNRMVHYVLSRLRWPSWPRADQRSWPDVLALFLMNWLVRLNEAGEFVLVRVGIKGPNRA